MRRASGSRAESARPPHAVSRLAAWIYLAFAVALIPWMAYLAVTLPRRETAHNYDLSWVGFDVGLLACLARTAWFAYRRSPRVALPAAATGVLLLVDAWFDVLTAASPSARLEAVLTAVVFELPGAAASLWLARRAMARVERAADLSPGE